jgi:hypothetical protein
MSDRFTPAVEAALRAAGWRPGRQLDDGTLAEMRRAVAQQAGLFGGRLHSSGHADRALAEFGGLVVDGDGPGVDLGPRPFALDPTMAAHSVETLVDAGRALGTDLYPLGVEGLDEAVLAIASHGEVLAIDPVGEWSLGRTVEEALETLVTGRRPRPATPSGERRPGWLPPPKEVLKQATDLPLWPLKRPIGAAFYLPRSAANLHYVWLPNTLARMGIVARADPGNPASFAAEWGELSCAVRALELESLTVLLLAFEQYQFLDQVGAAGGDPPVARAFRTACAGLAPDLEVAFLHTDRATDLLSAAVEHEYHVVTIDGTPLLDEGFPMVYLNGETDYGIGAALAAQPRDELPVPGGTIYAAGTGEARWR